MSGWTIEEKVKLLDAIMVCINEHPIVGQWITEILDRKTEPIDKDTNVRSKDCETCKWGEWYRNGRDITTMDDECGGCCSWNSKWTPKDEPQTELWHYDEKDCTWYPYSHDCGTCKNSLGDWDGHSLACGRCCNTDYEFYEPKTEPQTDCAWMKGE